MTVFFFILMLFTFSTQKSDNLKSIMMNNRKLKIYSNLRILDDSRISFIENQSINNLQIEKPNQQYKKIVDIHENKNLYNTSIKITNSLNQSQLKKFKNKKILDVTELTSFCNFLIEGGVGNAYLCKQLNSIYKQMKIPNPQFIINELLILQRLSIYESDLLGQIVTKNKKLVGHTMKYFQGKPILKIFQDPENIYYKNPVSRVRLIKKLKEQVIRIQQNNIVHYDLHFNNILIQQLDKTKQNCSIFIIDFGNSFIFDENKQIKTINTTRWLYPPESARGEYYNPKGINAYMFGRVAIKLLLGNKIDQYLKPTQEFRRMLQKQQKKIKSNIQKELYNVKFNLNYQLQGVTEEKFHESVKKQLQLYVHDDPEVRVNMLMSPSFMKQEMIEQVPLKKPENTNAINLKL